MERYVEVLIGAPSCQGSLPLRASLRKAREGNGVRLASFAEGGRKGMRCFMHNASFIMHEALCIIAMRLVAHLAYRISLIRK